MQEKKRILMIHPPFKELKFGNGWEGIDSLAPPLGLMFLGTPLIKDGYDVKFIDLDVDKITEEYFLLELSNADFILLSCYSESLKNVYKIIKKARTVNKKAYIICGGPYCKLSGNYVEDSDMTVVGEAEEYIASIINKIINKKSLSKIPGLIYKKDMDIVKNKGYLITKNLDNSISAASLLTRNKNYSVLFGYKVHGLVGISTSRDCPFNCNFCSHRGAFDKKIVRKRSVESVIKELKELQKRGSKYVMFYDENFLIDKKRVTMIMDRIVNEKIKLKMIVQGRVDFVDIEFYKKLYKAGVVMIMYGIENANQEVLDFYNKGTDINQIMKAIYMANKVGIITFGYFIIGSPIEDEKYIEKNKKFIKKVPLDFIFISVLTYNEGSELWYKAIKEGKIRESETTIYANENLSKYSHKEWINIRDELLKDFYIDFRRILRISKKFIKLRILFDFLRLLVKSKKDFLEKVKNPSFIISPDSQIDLINERS